MSNIVDNWFAVIVAVYLISMMLMGHHKGFIRLAVSMAALIITLVIVNFALPQVTSYLRENTTIHNAVQQGIKEITTIDPSLEEEAQLPAQQRLVIEHLNLPEQIKEALIQNNNNEVYQLLGVNAFADYIGSYLSNIVINTIAFILMFLIIRVILHFLVNWLDLIAKLPILSGLNKIAGAILGLIQGLVFFWIFSLLITIFSANTFSAMILNEIQQVPWLTFLYVNNIFSKIILSLVGGFL